MTQRWVVGVDVGGSGSRAAAVPLTADGSPASTGRIDTVGPRQSIGADGSAAMRVAAALVAELRARLDDAPVVAVGIGATGIAQLVADPQQVVDELTGALGVRVVAATDAATSHLGALGGAGGAVVALGTGAVVYATDWRSHTVLLDGWGHIIGDRGSGAGIGVAALRAAARAHDGVDESGDRLLRACRATLGEPSGWAAAVYLADDRAGVLASLVPAVARLASAGDAAAQAILDAAAGDAAATLLAGLAHPTPPRAAVTGGLRAVGPWFERAIADAVRSTRSDVELVPAAGDPLDGALVLAARHAVGAAPRVQGVWRSRTPRAGGDRV